MVQSSRRFDPQYVRCLRPRGDQPMALGARDRAPIFSLHVTGVQEIKIFHGDAASVRKDQRFGIRRMAITAFPEPLSGLVYMAGVTFDVRREGFGAIDGSPAVTELAAVSQRVIRHLCLIHMIAMRESGDAKLIEPRRKWHYPSVLSSIQDLICRMAGGTQRLRFGNVEIVLCGMAVGAGRMWREGGLHLGRSG